MESWKNHPFNHFWHHLFRMVLDRVLALKFNKTYAPSLMVKIMWHTSATSLYCHYDSCLARRKCWCWPQNEEVRKLIGVWSSVDSRIRRFKWFTFLSASTAEKDHGATRRPFAGRLYLPRVLGWHTVFSVRLQWFYTNYAGRSSRSRSRPFACFIVSQRTERSSSFGRGCERQSQRNDIFCFRVPVWGHRRLW